MVGPSMKLLVNAVLPWLGAFALLADGPVVINEIHHSPEPRQERVEFVELHNRGTNALDLAGWHLGGGVKFAFATNTIFPAGGYLVVAEDPAALAAKYRGTSSLGPWEGGLSGDGETLTLTDADGKRVDEVDYQLGFPWPTVGGAPGYSIELIHPDLDNSLGGNWRASVVGSTGQQSQTVVPAGSTWRYRKGTAEASVPSAAWRATGYDDSAWTEGALPIGYDPGVAFGTRLDDMRGAYRQVFLRKTFSAAGATEATTLRVEALYDDGFKLWLNGTPLLDVSMAGGEVPFDANSLGAAREDNSYAAFDIALPAGLLRPDGNVLAVQLANVDLSASSDAFFDAVVRVVSGPGGQGPTPGRRNAVFAANAPPALRQVVHSPRQPRSGEALTVNVRATDPDGVASVALEYQLVEPGSYLPLSDPAFATRWTRLAMSATAADTNVFAVTLPVELSRHRNLIRYRIIARDRLGAEVRAPYADDPVPDFAAFCYDGVPSWTGAIRPGAATALGQVFTVGTNEMNRLPVFHLLSRSNDVAVATGWAPGQPNNQYRGDSYLWEGTLVYDGEVYDHIRYRMRGGVWRYTMGKNAWKFDLNPGHDLKMRDDNGRRYRATWDKLSFRPDIQQGDYDHRGEQGLFESVGYKLFNLAGVDANRTTHVQFRVIDDVAESKPNDQYGGDFWGKYLAVEEQDGRFLKERGLADGNIFDMEGGSGLLNHAGKPGPLDRSDLNAFLNTYNSTTPTESWWRTNLDLRSYFGYQTIAQGIHHYDIADGKNYFYYRDPARGLWVVQPWDLDLTWANNMYRAGQTGGDEPFKSKVLSNFSLTAPRYPAIAMEFRNRVRELRDLLFNTDQAWAAIDEQALLIRGTEPYSITDVDRAQWDYNPVMSKSAITDASKAGQGRFYQFPQEPGVPRSFTGAVELMRRYVGYRSTNTTFSLDKISAEPDRPATPVLAFAGPAAFPVDRLLFHASPFNGAGTFRSVKWRLAEITRTNHPSYPPGEAWRYEIDPVWETAELTEPTTDLQIPQAVLRVGHLYRARVRHTDTTGRASNWSAPVEFTAGEPGNGAALLASLRLTEVMYNPPADGFEFVEVHNDDPARALDLAGAKFTAGIGFTFPAGATLAPGAFAVLVKTTNAVAFRAYHGLPAGFPLFGPYDRSLGNGGDTLTLKTASEGAVVFSVTYSDQPPWPVEADGTGRSLVPAVDGGADLDSPAYWRASTAFGGSPGRADPAPGRLEIGELKAGPDGLQVRVVTASDMTYVLETSPDLRTWTPTATNTGPAVFSLKFLPGIEGRFLRAARR